MLNIRNVLRLGLKKTFLALSSWERAFLVVVLGVAFGSLLYWLSAVYTASTVRVPKAGGEYIEGIVGQPRYINPILSQTSDADADLVELLFVGLLGYDADGRLEHRLAKEITVSEDGKIYTVKMVEGAKWHDGEEVTADDVVYTVQAIQDPVYKSPLRANWLSVDVRSLDRFTVEFSLKKPYFGFPENLTVGILPKHVWQDIAPEQFLLADYNVAPIGAGPYRYRDAEKDSNGTFLTYELEAHREYFSGAPFLNKFAFHFYPDETSLLEAFLRKEVMGMQSISAERLEQLKARKSAGLHEMALPRMFAVFFNTTKSVPLAHLEVRRALDMATDRDRIIKDVLFGKGIAAHGPFLSFMDNSASDIAWNEENIDQANALLDEKGWTRNAEGVREKNGTALRFQVIVPDWAELVKTAEILKEEWKAIGADMQYTVMTAGEMQQGPLKTREYEAVLFGQAAMLDEDPYSFWHSSQKKDPGLNLSLFDNGEADDILLKAREEGDANERKNLYRRFQEIFVAEQPAVFLYSPTYIAVMDKAIEGVDVRRVNIPSDRLSRAKDWYMKTKRVWK